MHNNGESDAGCGGIIALIVIAIVVWWWISSLSFDPDPPIDGPVHCEIVEGYMGQQDVVCDEQ